ncbi:MAG TPA: zinc ABC transporter substrate-binding protein [Ideonella sp.]|nr:zinc ABC transporter substrate-binding protein [Ideonella sp.]
MTPSRRTAIAALLALAASPALPQAPRPLRVVASFSILADLVRQVGGEAIALHTLVGPDADAHVFEPTPLDARRLAEAELVVVNGLGFEGWLERLVRASGYRGPVVVASEGITPRRLGKAPDPHAWQDLAHTRRYVRNLQAALAQARPTQAAAFVQRAAAYDAQLATLDAQVRKTFAAIAPARRRVISSHDAFGYFAAAYGVEFLAAQGLNTDSEASAAAVAQLIAQIRQQRVSAVFVENISNPRLVERIAREGGATLGGRLYSDALSAPGTEADSYLKLFAHNAATLAAGMAGPQGTPRPAAR